jgi:hypothetical protein
LAIRMTRKPRINEKWFSHPLVLLIVGAIISSILIPWFTRGWQNYQQELEIKKELVGDISEAVMKLVMEVQSFEIQLKNETLSGNLSALKPQREKFNLLFSELNEDYREWEVSSAVIGSQLRAYFRDSEIAPKWGIFSQNLTRFYADTQTDYEDALYGSANESWRDERERLLKEKDELIRIILDKPIYQSIL